MLRESEIRRACSASGSPGAARGASARKRGCATSSASCRCSRPRSSRCGASARGALPVGVSLLLCELMSEAIVRVSRDYARASEQAEAQARLSSVQRALAELDELVMVLDRRGAVAMAAGPVDDCSGASRRARRPAGARSGAGGAAQRARGRRRARARAQRQERRGAHVRDARVSAARGQRAHRRRRALARRQRRAAPRRGAAARRSRADGAARAPVASRARPGDGRAGDGDGIGAQQRAQRDLDVAVAGAKGADHADRAGGAPSVRGRSSGAARGGAVDALAAAGGASAERAAARGAAQRRC